MILLLSILIGIVLSTQLKMVSKSTGGVVSSQKAKQLAGELKGLKDRKEELQKELGTLENRIDEYKRSEENEDIFMRNMKKDIERYEIMLGYTKVKGPGIKLVLEDKTEDGTENVLLYNYDLLLAIVNRLNASGAEAISINDERIIATTEMHLTEDNGEKLLINEKPVVSPFVIKAIGDPNTLDAALNIRYGILYDIRELYSLKTEISKEQELEIPRYNGTVEFKFAKPNDME